MARQTLANEHYPNEPPVGAVLEPDTQRVLAMMANNYQPAVVADIIPPVCAPCGRGDLATMDVENI